MAKTESTAETKAKMKTVHEFRITLRGIRPPIWRRIRVPTNYSFWDLHVAIQDAMGWLDSHLHAFRPESDDEIEIGIPSDDPFVEDTIEMLAGWHTPMTEYLAAPGDRIEYAYDFGDDWTHDVVLDAVVERESRRKYPICVDGARACPPEDCGGVQGYKDLLKILADPEHDEYASMTEWLGRPFDPEAFDPGRMRFEDPQERWRFAFHDA